MDHSKCRGKIGQLENEVMKVVKDNDELRKENLNNAEVSLKKESVLKKLVETLRKEIDDLKSSDLIVNLETENNDLKLKIEELESDKRAMKISLDYNEEENEVVINHYKTEHKILQNEVINLKTCDDCDVKFEEKAQLKTHILVNHSVERMKCDKCGEGFKEKDILQHHNGSKHLIEEASPFKCNECEYEIIAKDDLKTHISTEHTRKINMLEILKKERQIQEQVSQQKINLYESLYKLKQKEERKKFTCSCRGQHCRINHFKYRWTASKSDDLVNRLKTTTSSDYNVINCNKCDQRFVKEEDLKLHITTNHKAKLHRSKFACQPCEQSFLNEDNLMSHIDDHHERSPLEATFFNPSASS